MAQKSSLQTSTKRLMKEYQKLVSEPLPHILARPNADVNIFDWYYVITGPKGSPYEGGQYFGKLHFPVEYPFKPPSIMMTTPNGRFATDTRLCLSMSDFHPETWNCLWTIGSILNGLLSFMLEETPTHGSIQCTTDERRKLAAESHRFNRTNTTFRKLYADLLESPPTKAARITADTKTDNGKPDSKDDSQTQVQGQATLQTQTSGSATRGVILWIIVPLIIAVVGVYVAVKMRSLLHE